MRKASLRSDGRASWTREAGVDWAGAVGRRSGWKLLSRGQIACPVSMVVEKDPAQFGLISDLWTLLASRGILSSHIVYLLLLKEKKKNLRGS